MDKRYVLMLGGVALMLALAVAALVSGGLPAPAPDDGPSATPTGTATPAAVATATPGMAPSGGAEFDPSTATPALDNSPEAHVSAYYAALKSRDYAGAYLMQPAASRKGGDAEDFAATQKSYGMVGYEVGVPKASGDAVSVTVSQDLGVNGKWDVTWNFRESGGEWYVENRMVAMVSQGVPAAP